MSQQPDDDRPTVHFKGPGQWRSQADAVQEPEPDEPDDEPGDDSGK